MVNLHVEVRDDRAARCCDPMGGAFALPHEAASLHACVAKRAISPAIHVERIPAVAPSIAHLLHAIAAIPARALDQGRLKDDHHRPGGDYLPFFFACNRIPSSLLHALVVTNTSLLFLTDEVPRTMSRSRERLWPMCFSR